MSRMFRITALVGFVAYGAATSLAGAPSATDEIPDWIVYNAERYMVDRVGQDFFEAYFRFVRGASMFVEGTLVYPPFGDGPYVQPHYVIAYRFRMPQNPFVDELVSCVTRVDGTLLELRSVPDCVGDPEECQFPIDEEGARQIAIDEGLAEGTTDWMFSFHWHYLIRSFIWTVSNTLEKEPNGAKGEMVIIDANTGEPHPRGHWFQTSG